MGQYGGTNFSKRPSHMEIPGKEGNKGILPNTSAPKSNVGKGIDFPGHKGDKGTSCGKNPGYHGPSKAAKGD